MSDEPFRLLERTAINGAWYTGVETKNLKVPDYVHDGMFVLIPWAGGTGIWCEVLVAAGNRARVFSRERGIDEWFSLESLRVRRTSKEIAKASP
jgi:hypothetical protein